LASIPGVALAQQGGNSACDEFCHQNFSGRAAGKCTSAGAHGTGPCYTCTLGIGPGPHFTTPQCGTNKVFNPDTCACVVGCSPAGVCGAGAPPFPDCSEDPLCACVQTVEGLGFCSRNQSCSESQTCTTTADCPAGYACTAVSCCPDFAVCAPPCAGTSGLTAARTAGPTILGG